MKLKGIELKGAYTVKFARDYFEVFDKENNKIYYENNRGGWFKRNYDERNNEVYYENSKGYWHMAKYDKRDNQIYMFDCKGEWYEAEYDERGNEVYYEDSNGIIVDKREKKELKDESNCL